MPVNIVRSQASVCRETFELENKSFGQAFSKAWRGARAGVFAFIASYRKQRERMPVMIGTWNAIILVGAADRSAEREIPAYSQIREDRGLGEVPHF